MAKKASKKKATTKKKATKKKTTKKVSKKTTAKIDPEVKKRIEAIKSGAVNPTSARPTMADAYGTLDEATRASFRTATEARSFREFRLFTGIIDFDLFCGVTFGKRIQFVGDPNYGKTLLLYACGGGMHKTCRYCYTPIIPWVDDWSTYVDGEEGPKNWAKLYNQWTETGVCPFPVTTTCRCGKNDKMSILLIDAEEAWDPYWGNIWGMDVGNFEDYEAYDVDNVQKPEAEGGGTVWQGLMISPDAKLLICRPKSSLTIEKVVLPMIRSGAVDAILIDSLAAFAIEEDIQGNERIASRARFMRRFLPLVLSAQIDVNEKFGAKVSVLATNQYMQGPKANAKANPNTIAGGQAIKYQADQTLEITRSAKNVALGDKGWQHRTIMRDLGFFMSKAKVSGSDGGRGQCRVYLDDYDMGKGVIFRAGNTNDPERILSYIREDKKLKDAGVYVEEKTKGGSTKAHWVLGRPFKRVKDIVAFLQRPDVQYQIRFIIYSVHLGVTGRLHLRGDNYGYNPFRQDPAVQLIETLDSTVGESFRQVRLNAETAVERPDSFDDGGGDDEEFSVE